MVFEAMRRGELIYGKYGEYRKRWVLNYSWKKKNKVAWKLEGGSLDEWAICFLFFFMFKENFIMTVSFELKTIPWSGSERHIQMCLIL